MKTLFTAEVTSKGGRSGNVKSADGLLDTELGNPLDPEIKDRGPNPETLFGAAYAACFNGAITNNAEKIGIPIGKAEVRAVVRLLEDDQGGYNLAVDLHANIPGVDRPQALRILDAAHKTCPYSKALRGSVVVNVIPE